MLLYSVGEMPKGAMGYCRFLVWRDGRRGLESHPPMIVPFWVGRIDSGSVLLGLYIIPLRNCCALLHDTTAHLMRATQYALGGFQKAGVGTFQPPL